MKKMSMNIGLRGGWRWLVGAGLALTAATSFGAAGTAQRVSGEQPGNCFNPTLSPDGKRLSYEVNYFDRRTIELYVRELPGGADKQVKPLKSAAMDLGSFGATGGGDLVTYELAWSPNRAGQYLFSSSGGDKNFDIYDARGGVLAGHPAAEGQPTYNSDGTLIVFTSARTGEGDLYLMDVRNPASPQLKQLSAFKDGPEWYATFAPNSNRLAFVRHTPSDGDHLYIMPDPLSPNKVEQLTSWAAISTKPSWSPDGTKIAFYSNRDNKDRYDLYVMDARKGATPVKLLDGVIPNERRGPAWTPDGKALLQVIDRPADFSPILVVSASQPGVNKVLPTGTQNNGDVFVVKVANGPTLVTFVSQGRQSDATKNFKRVFLYEAGATDVTLP